MRNPLAALTRRRPPDPWVMYLVVRRGVRLDLATACALAGGATVACARQHESDPALRRAFECWRAGATRKVTLRADDAQLAALLGAVPGVAAGDPARPDLICLVPRRRSDSGPLLAALPAFTDARRPVEPAPPLAPDVPALTYVLAAQLGMTAGKAMAQAGHGALLCADDARLGDAGAGASAWAAWARAGHPGRVVAATSAELAAIASSCPCVVVRDAGLTQVAAGSQTLLCLPPQVTAELAPKVAALGA